MIIEYSEDEFVVEEERVIDGETHRVIRYDTGFYAVQSKNYKGEWETWLISPKPNVREIMSADEIREMEKEKEFFIVGFESFMGRADLLGVLEAYNQAYKLKNGEYWSLELTLDYDLQSKESQKVLSEIISRSDGEGLLSTLEDLGRYPIDESYNDNVGNLKYIVLMVIGIYIIVILCLAFGK